jgi:hypothetical protein
LHIFLGQVARLEEAGLVGSPNRLEFPAIVDLKAVLPVTVAALRR